MLATGERVIHEKAKDASEVHVTNIAPGTIRAQMSKLSDDENSAGEEGPAGGVTVCLRMT